jgi:hypothetical protein
MQPLSLARFLVWDIRWRSWRRWPLSPNGLLPSVALWRLHRAASSLLLTSTGLLVIGFAVAPLFPALSSIIIAGSIMVYGLAYTALGQVAVTLGQDHKT